MGGTPKFWSDGGERAVYGYFLSTYKAETWIRRGAQKNPLVRGGYLIYSWVRAQAGRPTPIPIVGNLFIVSLSILKFPGSS